MAIKKCLVFLFVFVLLFSFSLPAFAVDYFQPTPEEYQTMMDNVFYSAPYQFHDSTTANIPSLDFSSFGDVRYFLVYQSGSSLLAFPVPLKEFVYQGTSFSLFGLSLDLYNDSVFLLPGYDLGIGFGSNPVMGLSSTLLCKDSLKNSSGTVYLTYLDSVPGDFIPSVTSGLNFIIQGLGSLLSSVLSPGGILFPLMQLLLLGISVTFLLFSVRIIRRFIWGD